MIKINFKNLHSGDILLFHQKKSCLGKMIQCFTRSKYCHIGIVLKDPIFLKKNLKDLYLLESGYEDIPDAYDYKIKLGVQLQKLEPILEEYGKGNVYVRVFYSIKPINNKLLKEIYDKIQNKPYDLNPFDWLEAELKLPCKIGGDTDKRFWCSALVGYVYFKMGWMKEPKHWSLLSPEDWDSKERKIKTIGCHLSKEYVLDF